MSKPESVDGARSTLLPSGIKPYFEDGTVTIYHGDCREILSGLAYDCVVTDPPYGIGFAAQPTKWQRRTKIQGGRVAGGQASKWDDRTVDTLVVELAADPRPTIIWGGNYYALPPRKGWLCWTKPDAPPSMGGFELAWTNLDRVTRFLSCSISQTNPERLGHPTQKPEKVIAWCLGFVSGVVCDPFMGSGTTLRCAKNLGMRAIGIETEEKYCEMAARRMSQQVLGLGGAA